MVNRAAARDGPAGPELPSWPAGAWRGPFGSQLPWAGAGAAAQPRGLRERRPQAWPRAPGSTNKSRGLAQLTCRPVPLGQSVSLRPADVAAEM